MANKELEKKKNILPSYIPSTMMTQHPDNARTMQDIDKGFSTPEMDDKLERVEILRAVLPEEKWKDYTKNVNNEKILEGIQKILKDDKYKNVIEHIPADLGIEEAMIDYEGKLTPYIMLQDIVSQLIMWDCYPGIDVFVTPRIPASGEEKEPAFNQIMTLTAIFAANNAAYRACDDDDQFKNQEHLFPQAIFEMILPMCTKIDEIEKIHDRLAAIYNSLEEDYKKGSALENFRVIPLIEDVTELIMIDDILRGYIGYLITKLGIERVMERPIRIMLGRSDPAIFFGMVPSVLAVKLALSKCAMIEKEYGGKIQIAPILGVGSLPFRGHLTPDNFENVFKEYPGVKTVTIQSALRYDYDSKMVRKQIKEIKKHIFANPFNFKSIKEENILDLIVLFTIEYWNDSATHYNDVKKIFKYIPPRRRRLIATGRTQRYGRGAP